jgi:hypothetical protein
MYQYIVTPLTLSDLIIAIPIAILIWVFGYNLIKVFNQHFKTEKYKGAFYLAILHEIAKKNNLDIEQYIEIEKKHKTVDSLISQKVKDAIEKYEIKTEKKPEKETDKS